jgi:hypothetical protein
MRGFPSLARDATLVISFSTDDSGEFLPEGAQCDPGAIPCSREPSKMTCTPLTYRELMPRRESASRSG